MWQEGSSVVTSDQESEEEEEVEEEKEVAVWFGIAHVKVDQVPVSSNCICILFCIRVIVM